ncbi:hypothetical protein N7E81_12265 [Reichenbachiella carrageenanivorans]|uniref:Lipoprotein n=1 Tax=Reichenbachiella carrageenanivorans TaxID=2979869 RepID=A0ABY6CZ89_9BACT|nr:hypothetical protein [Reichenbachiella carrageenanivorans]UXX78133.1 hypothetical protein N7E81_12265 [Reichenbachiella carrageenanivorans]
MMKLVLKNMLWGGLVMIFITSCDIKDNKDVEPSASFLKIYDSHQFDHAIGAVDVVQKEDEGYLLLGNYRRDDTNFLGVYVACVDKEGQFVRNTYLRDNNVHPVGKFLMLGGQRYFVSMDAIGLHAYLNQVDDSARIVSTVALGVTYPMYAENDGEDQFVLLSYDSEDKKSVLSLMNTDGVVASQSTFGIGAGQGVEEPIIDHFTRTGRELPFFAGRVSNGLYYANAFFNYTLSLLFTDLSSNTPSGVVQGQQDEGGISGLLPLDGGQFSLARFNFGDHYANARETLNTGGISSVNAIEGNPMLEWETDEKVKMINITLQEVNYTVIATTTKNQQIVLHIYDAATGDYMAVDYLGFSNPYQLGALTLTEDNGLAVLGSTQVVGKFQRLCLFKLSEGELLNVLN